MPTFVVKTLGCKANQYDSDLLRERLTAAGLVEASDGERAEVCIVNTCTVTEQSDAKSRQAIRQLRQHHPDAAMVVTGCYVDRSAAAVGALGKIDVLVGNNGKDEIVGRLRDLGVIDSAQGCIPDVISRVAERTRAFVKVQDGCDAFCSYCIIPHVRGRSRSRPVQEIGREVRALVEHGYREVVLTGIHLGAFGAEEDGRHRLAELIAEVGSVEGLRRLRLSSIDPQEVTDDLLAAMHDSPLACHHLHISLQSGSDRVLAAMRRTYTAEQYLDVVRRVREALDDPAVSTDLMVGFPGETDEDFRQSLALVEACLFSKVHVFPFSRRPGTVAATMRDQVPSRVIRERVQRGLDVAQRVAIKARAACVGKRVEILVEGEPSDGIVEGFTDNYMRCVATSNGSPAPIARNDVVPVIVTGVEGLLLRATVAGTRKP